MIEEFLKSVDNEPPTFLLPHYRYHKKLKPGNVQNNGNDQTDVANNLGSEKADFNDEYFNDTVERVNYSSKFTFQKDTC